jgi:hypothetical protein
MSETASTNVGATVSLSFPRHSSASVTSGTTYNGWSRVVTSDVGGGPRPSMPRGKRRDTAPKPKPRKRERRSPRHTQRRKG